MKSLKTQCKEFINKVDEELRTIKTQEVSKRHLALEQLKRIEESAKETVELEEKTIEKVDEVLQAPEVIKGQMSIDDFEEKKVKITFTVYGTVPELKEVKEFLEKRGLKYEQCK